MKGVYCLVIKVKKDTNIEVGAIGNINFKKGTYVYVGSAQNSLEKRIKRHYSLNKKFHWHIDYLLDNPNVKIEHALYKIAPKKQECKIAQELLKTEFPIKEFGCSDCNCKSHLFKLSSLESINKLKLNEMQVV